ncbi:hypothetical protein [Dyella psychrodurans]|uniref:DUF7931 domain-containing protein n=1 Tax=Dyella psychrodurans TaxID=1927960 RepID=A0A370XDG6_9GAMM|nr:hypothetical protein [Dyella psychrodurans]RDS86474.1 hypothetical protein DWU99_04345 [Dyella psychrodurans]
MSTTPPDQDAGPRAVSGREDIAEARLQLLTAARYKLSIYLPSLPADIYNSLAELAELRRIATSGRGAEIRVLLGDPANVLREGHRLIDLAQRLPSALQIRVPSDDQVENRTTSAWLINDTYGYLFLPDADRVEGRAAMHDGPGLAPLLLQFDQMWERAVPATQLQPLGL